MRDQAERRATRRAGTEAVALSQLVAAYHHGGTEQLDWVLTQIAHRTVDDLGQLLESAIGVLTGLIDGDVDEWCRRFVDAARREDFAAQAGVDGPLGLVLTPDFGDVS